MNEERNKFFLTTAVIIANIVLLVFKQLPAAEYAQIVTWTIGLYMGANVGARAANQIGPMITGYLRSREEKKSDASRTD